MPQEQSLDSAGSIDINVVDGQTVNVGLNGAVETAGALDGTAGSELWSAINTSEQQMIHGRATFIKCCCWWHRFSME